MKINRLFIWALAVTAAVASCENKIAPEQTPDGSDAPAQTGFTFTATTESDSSQPQAKATIGLNDNNKVQTFWEDGDKISVYSSANHSSTDKVSSYIFSTTLSQNSTSAKFTFDGDFAEGEKYLAIYPSYSSKRVANFEAQVDNQIPARYEGNAYRMAQVDVPKSQTLVAGGFDKDAAVAIAVANGTNTLNFKNAVSLIKFKVANTDVVSGSIVASAKIGGTFRADILEADGTPILIDYLSTSSSSIDFTIDGATPLSTETEYYVAVRPTDLSAGFAINLNGKLVKEYTLPKFERNKIYDLGTLTIPEEEAEVVTTTLTFDFSVADNLTENWPSTNKPAGAVASDIFEAVYTLNGEQYTFILRNPADAASINFPYIKSGKLFVPKYRYVGLPALEGYKLTQVKFMHGSGGIDANRAVGVTSEVVSGSEALTQVWVSGGDLQGPTLQLNTEYTYDLSFTNANTRYYLWVYKQDTLISSITLTYTQVSSN